MRRRAMGARIFLLLTFAVSWGCWIPLTRGVALGSALGQFLLLVGTFAPAIVALGLTAWREGSVASLVARIVPPRVSAPWVAFALFYGAAFRFAAAAIHRVILGAWPAFDFSELALVPFAIVISTPVQAGEELGWRGFALPRLTDRLGLGPASVLVGIAWAAWHLPLFFVPGADKFGQSFFVYLAQVTAFSVAIAFLWDRSGRTLLLPMLLHASINNTQFVRSAVPEATRVFGFSASAQAWIGAGVLWFAAAFMLAAMARSEPERAQGPATDGP